MSGRLEAQVIGELESGGRVLVSRLEYLGDIILTLPMVQLLRERFPSAAIDYLARAPAADILVGERQFDRVFRIPEPGSTGSSLRMIRELRARRYVLAIDLYSNPRSAMTLWLCGARMRIGGDRRGRRRLYTHPITVPGTIRAATRFHIEHLKPLGIAGDPAKPELCIAESEHAEAQSQLAGLGLNIDRPIVGIHPGGKWEVKRWPVELFVSLTQRLIEDHGMQVLVMSGPGEDVYRDGVREGVGDRAWYLPILPVRKTAAIINALDAMVASDGGIMHVSVAVGTATVGIFGSAEPDIWFPYEAQGPYLPAFVPITCRPCHRHLCNHISCLYGVTTGLVEQKLLAVTSPSSSATRAASDAGRGLSGER